MNPCLQEPEGATDGADKYPGMGLSGVLTDVYSPNP